MEKANEDAILRQKKALFDKKSILKFYFANSQFDFKNLCLRGSSKKRLNKILQAGIPQ